MPDRYIHVVVREFPKECKGAVYDPRELFGNSERLSALFHNAFFQPGRIYRSVTILTEKNPAEIAELLVEDFGVKNGSSLGTVVALFTAKQVQAETLLDYLEKHPDKYLKKDGDGQGRLPLDLPQTRTDRRQPPLFELEP